MMRSSRRRWLSAAALGLATCLTGADCDWENFAQDFREFVDDVNDDSDDDFFGQLLDDIEDGWDDLEDEF